MKEAVAVVGLGYVGLPIAVALAHHHKVVGFDISTDRINELRSGIDRTLELQPDELAASTNLYFTDEKSELSAARRFVVCVPTPIDEHREPDLAHLTEACATVGAIMTRGSLVVFESTVYPGVTDEICTPILSEHSGLSVNSDFWVGYSPERINPGDRHHRLEDITKVIAGSSEDAVAMVQDLYQSIIRADLHVAPSIRVAEAAKVIENTQRDLNIALVNELAKIFDLIGIDTRDVLDAASTKWNFVRFEPGLVGGHCIGVDPYYLTHLARKVGYTPQVIESGRAINNSMSNHVADRLFQHYTLTEKPKVLVLGITFKEDCPDTRNSLTLDLIAQLMSRGALVSATDPWVDEAAAHKAIPAGSNWIPWDVACKNVHDPYDAVVVAVGHRQFKELGESVSRLVKSNGAIFDVKGILPRDTVTHRL